MIASTGNTALAVLIALSIVVPLTILGFVVFFFFRAARRADAEARDGTPPLGSGR